ncbi:MAG: diphthine--ammonia ligase [Gemmatimonadetes bacterium]|nr:diphthine--ammonia ligase [Gemmatimonadota bacterium]
MDDILVGRLQQVPGRAILARVIYAVSWSGGKDSALALDRAVRGGLRVQHLFNIYEGSSGRVRFHGVRRELIRAQADALGLDLIQAHTHPADFEAVFASVLDELEALEVDGVVFGNIHLADIRAWYEERTTARGFEHREPLWEENPAALLDEALGRGYRARVVSVNLELGRGEWLGRELDAALAAELKALPDVDPAGERGEYHTFVFDGPLFREPLQVADGEVFEREGHLVLDLLPAPPPPVEQT